MTDVATFIPLFLDAQVVLKSCLTFLNATEVFLAICSDYLESKSFLITFLLTCGICLLSFEVVTQVEKIQTYLTKFSKDNSETFLSCVVPEMFLYLHCVLDSVVLYE